VSGASASDALRGAFVLPDRRGGAAPNFRCAQFCAHHQTLLSATERQFLCRCLCRNPGIPIRIGGSRVISFGENCEPW